MKFDSDLHHRRSIRLPGYDYSQPRSYFITICTHNRELLLEDERVGEIVRSVWDGLPRRYPAVCLDEFVIMPNHIHGIVVLQDQGAASSAPTDRRPALGQVIRAFKSVSAIEANRCLDRSGAFWQRNYYEHIIRDEGESNTIRQYIRDNPTKWDQDPDNPASS